MADTLAVVMGDMDLVRPVGEAGVRCAVVAHRNDPTPWSRYVEATIDADAPDLIAALIDFAHGRGGEHVLFYEADWSTQLISQHRDKLSEEYRFVIADAELLDCCMQKDLFYAFAEGIGLSVPRSLRAAPASGPPPSGKVPFPLIVKPLPGRDDDWDLLVGRTRKAVRVDDEAALEQLWERLAGRPGGVMLQELIPGPESAIESYHAYVAEDGMVVAEFTGRKIRTFPLEFGASCALETTHAPDVVEAGRAFVEGSGFRGVLKADYKRRPDGALTLFEVNPRFSLWHGLGAKAGVNIPAFVIADLTGSPRPAARQARAGVTWCDPATDVKAARESGIPPRRWLWWALTDCDVLSAVSLRDPMPLLRGKLLPRLRRGAPG